MAELSALCAFGVTGEPPAVVANDSEARVQSLVRLEAARAGWFLWRNNVGALKDEGGRLVRYGLANDSAQLNARLKSGDLVGFRPLMITADMVGRVVAQFVSRECKPSGWRWSGSERETAQMTWVHLVVTNGGDACFASGEGTI